MVDDTLPSGWVHANLPDLAAINPPLDRCFLDEQTDVGFIPMASVGEEFRGIQKVEHRPYASVKKGYTPFIHGDVIFAKITPCMQNGKGGLVDGEPDSVYFGSTEFHVFRPKPGVAGRWIAHFLAQQELRRKARMKMKGSAGQLRVPLDFIESVSLPLAPTAEQERIADRIDELFTDLDAGVAALERVKRNLKRYRAAVLHAAVTGRLTAAWRKEHGRDDESGDALLSRILVERRRQWERRTLAGYEQKGRTPPKNWKSRYKQPAPPKTDDLPTLPKGWCWATLDQVGLLQRGRSRHRPRDADHLYGGPYPFIQTGDIRRANQFVRSHTQTYSEAGLAQSQLWPAGTLCITIAANIAETAILSYPACFPDSIVGFQAAEPYVNAQYVMTWIETIRAKLDRFAPATAQKNINDAILSQVAIALPSSREQAAIVEAVQEKLSQIDGLEAEVEHGLKRAGRLRQAILKAAFAGRLVEQDPRDEPASALLNRLRAEREHAGPRRSENRRTGATARRKQPSARQNRA